MVTLPATAPERGNSLTPVKYSFVVDLDLETDTSSDAIYFHYPCFDGLVSAAIAMDYLETWSGWDIRNTVPVDYGVRQTWLNSRFPHRFAVVDFLYHPRAEFWADHHPTSFLNSSLREDAEQRKMQTTLLYDPDSPSCSLLLIKELGSRLTSGPRYSEMAYWATKIDSANYDSPQEAIFGDSPAMEINLSLSDERALSPDYAGFLLNSIRSMDIADVAALPMVQQLVRQVRQRTARGLTNVRESIRYEAGDIVVFEARHNKDALISRYSPYEFFPEARYSVGLVESDRDLKITAMRNPWLEFPSVPLGEIFQRFGGGGHQRVASVLMPHDSVRAKHVLKDIVEEIRERDATADAAPRRSIR